MDRKHAIDVVKPVTWILLLAGFLLNSCQTAQTVQEPFHFYFAGHTYGYAMDPMPKGLWAPFRKSIESINRDTLAKFLVFGGDVVKKAQDSLFDAFDADRSAILLPQYFAPGNHDLAWNKLEEPFDQRYAEKPFIRYRHFQFNHNHFFILDPHIAKWNIAGEQYEWLKSELEQTQAAENLFFFTHELLWWEKDTTSEWHLPKPNSDFDRADTLNFWSEIVPLLASTGKHCYWLAGDIAADCSRPDRFFAEATPQLHFIASGMGCTLESNYLQVRVAGPGAVQFIAMGIGEENQGRQDTLSLKDRNPRILRPLK